MVRVAFLGLAVLLVPSVCLGQVISAFAGYEWAHPSAENVHLMTTDVNGWSVGLLFPARFNLGIVLEADGAYATPVATGIVIRPNGSVRPFYHSGEVGPRYTFLRGARLTPYVDAVVGVVHAQVTSFGVDFISPVTDTRLQWGLDAGVRMVLVGRVGIDSTVGYRRSELFDQRLSRVQLTERVFVDVGRK